MGRLLQISDPHFGTERPEVVEALVDLAACLRPDLVVMSGDITQRAKPSQFARARHFLDRLDVPRALVLPGNHDIPLFDLLSRTLRPYAAFARAFGSDLEPVIDIPDLLAIGVKTTRRLRHKHGEVSADQIERVRRRLAAARTEQLRLVVTHQPMDVARPRDEHHRVRGSDAALQTWVEAGADLVMGGHIHLPYVRALSQRLPGLSRRAWCVQAGTAVSSRVRQEAANSVQVVRYATRETPARCTVERWDCVRPGAVFMPAESWELVLDRDVGA